MWNTELHYEKENIELKCGAAETGKGENNHFNDAVRKDIKIRVPRAVSKMRTANASAYEC